MFHSTHRFYILCVCATVLFVSILAFAQMNPSPPAGMPGGTMRPPMPQRSQQAPPPLLIYTIRSPFIAIPGSDSPIFVYYADGLVIYRTLGKHSKPSYMSVKVDSLEMAAIMKRLFDADAFFELHNNYSPSSGLKDEPLHELFIAGPEPAKKEYRFNLVTVYGQPDTMKNGGDRDDSLLCPQAFLDFYKWVAEYKNAQAKPWLPAKLEVVVTVIDSVMSTTTVYPANWPLLSSKEVVTRGQNQKVFSVYLPESELGTVQKIIKNKDVMKVEDKLVMCREMRYPFPHEMMGFDPRNFMQQRAQHGGR